MILYYLFLNDPFTKIVAILLQVPDRGSDTKHAVGADAMGAVEHGPEEEVRPHVALDEAVDSGKTEGENISKLCKACHHVLSK